MALGANWGLSVSINTKALNSFNTTSRALERGAERIASVGKQANKALDSLNNQLDSTARHLDKIVSSMEKLANKTVRGFGGGAGGGGDFVFPRMSHARKGAKGRNATDSYMRDMFGIPKAVWDEYAPTRKQNNPYSAFVGTFPRPLSRGSGNSRERYYNSNQVMATLMKGTVTAPIVKAIERLENELKGALQKLSTVAMGRPVAVGGAGFGRAEDMALGKLTIAQRQVRDRGPPIPPSLGRSFYKFDMGPQVIAQLTKAVDIQALRREYINQVIKAITGNESKSLANLAYVWKNKIKDKPLYEIPNILAGLKGGNQKRLAENLSKFMGKGGAGILSSLSKAFWMDPDKKTANTALQIPDYEPNNLRARLAQNRRGKAVFTPAQQIVNLGHLLENLSGGLTTSMGRPGNQSAAAHLANIERFLVKTFWPKFLKWLHKEGIDGSAGAPSVSAAQLKPSKARKNRRTKGETNFASLEEIGDEEDPIQKSRDKFRNAMSRVINIGSAASIVYGGATLVKDAVRDMASFEVAIKRVQMAMNPTTKDFYKMSEAARGMAEQFGVGISEVADAMATFAKQGNDAETVVKQTAAAIAFTKTTSMSLEEAIDGIVAAQKEFSLGNQSGMRVLDSFATLEKQTAIRANDLAEATKAAGVASRTAGIDFDTFEGIVAAVGETTRKSGDTIGTALKDIFQHIRDVKAVEALQGVGVFSEDAIGNFKSARDVLGELAGRWGRLTDAQRNNVATSVAGIEHLNDFSILMEKWGRAMDLATNSLHSQGNGMRLNAQAMSTLEEHVNQLKASLQGLFSEVGESGMLELFKTMVDLAKQAVHLFGSINKLGGGLPASLLGSTALLAGGAAATNFATNIAFPALRGGSQVLSRRRVPGNVTGSETMASVLMGGENPGMMGTYFASPGHRWGAGLLLGSSLAQYGYNRYGRQGPPEAPSLRDTAVDVATTGASTAGLLGMFGGPKSLWNSGKLGKAGLAIILAAGVGQAIGQIQKYRHSGDISLAAGGAYPKSATGVTGAAGGAAMQGAAIAITQAHNLNQLVVQYGQVVDRLIAKNNDLLKNVDTINQSVSSLSFASPESFIGSKASIQNVQRTIAGYNEMNRRGVSGFAAPNFNDPRGIQNALIDLRGSVNMQRKAPFGISAGGLLSAQFTTEDLANKFVAALDQPIRKLFEKGGNMLLANPDHTQDPQEQLFYKRLQETLGPEATARITEMATKAGSANAEEQKELLNQALRIARTETKTSLSDIAEKMRDSVREAMQGQIQSVQNAVQTLGVSFAQQQATGRVGGIGQFMATPEAAGVQKEITQLTSSAGNLVSTLEKRLQTLAPGSEDYQNTSKQLDVLRAQFSTLSTTTEHLDSYIKHVVVGMDELNTVIARVRNAAGLGGAFGQTGANAEKYGVGFLTKELRNLGEQLSAARTPMERDNITAQINAAREELVGRQRNLDIIKDNRSAVGAGLTSNVLAARLQQAVGLPVENAIGDWRDETERSFREMLQTIAKDYAPAVKGKGAGAIQDLVEKLRPVLNVVGGKLHDLQLDSDADFRKQYLLASPSQRLSADAIRQQIRGGATAEQIFSDPYARAAAKSNPLLDKLLDQALQNDESQLKALDFQADIARYNEESVKLLQQIYNTMVNPARAAAGLGPAQMPAAPFTVPGERYAVGSMARAGKGNIDPSGRIKRDWTPAYLDKGEIVLNRRQSEAYLRSRNRFDRGTTPLPKVIMDHLASLPPVAKGYHRMYRGENTGFGKKMPSWLMDNAEIRHMSENVAGRWFNSDPALAYWYFKDAGKNALMSYVDVPHDVYRNFRVDQLPDVAKFSADPRNEWFLPKELADSRRPFYDSAIHTTGSETMFADLGRRNRAARRATLTIPTDVTHPNPNYYAGGSSGLSYRSNVMSPRQRRALAMSQAFASAERVARGNGMKVSLPIYYPRSVPLSVLGGPVGIRTPASLRRNIPLSIFGGTGVGINPVAPPAARPSPVRLPMDWDTLMMAKAQHQEALYGAFKYEHVYGHYKNAAVKKALSQGYELARNSAGSRGLSPELFDQFMSGVQVLTSKPMHGDTVPAWFKNTKIDVGRNSIGISRQSAIRFTKLPVGPKGMAHGMGVLLAHEGQHALDQFLMSPLFAAAPAATRELQNKVIHKLLVHSMLDESAEGLRAKRAVFYGYHKYMTKQPSAYEGMGLWLKEVRAAKAESGTMNAVEKGMNAILAKTFINFHEAARAGDKASSFRAMHSGLEEIDQALTGAGISDKASFSLRQALTGTPKAVATAAADSGEMAPFLSGTFSKLGVRAARKGYSMRYRMAPYAYLYSHYLGTDAPRQLIARGLKAYDRVAAPVRIGAQLGSGLLRGTAEAFSEFPGVRGLGKLTNAGVGAFNKLHPGVRSALGIAASFGLESDAVTNFANAHGLGGLHSGAVAVSNLLGGKIGADMLMSGHGMFGLGVAGRLASQGGTTGLLGTGLGIAEKGLGRLNIGYLAAQGGVSLASGYNKLASVLGQSDVETHANAGSINALGDLLNLGKIFRGKDESKLISIGNKQLAKGGVGFFTRHFLMSDAEVAGLGQQTALVNEGTQVARLRGFMMGPLVNAGKDPRTIANSVLNTLGGWGLKLDPNKFDGVMAQLLLANPNATGLNLLSALGGSTYEDPSKAWDFLTNGDRLTGGLKLNRAQFETIGDHLDYGVASKRIAEAKAAQDKVDAENGGRRLKAIFGFVSNVKDKIKAFSSPIIAGAIQNGIAEQAAQVAADNAQRAAATHAAAGQALKEADSADLYISRLGRKPHLDISTVNAFDHKTGALIKGKFERAVKLSGEDKYYYGSDADAQIKAMPGLMRQYAAMQSKSALSMGIMNHLGGVQNMGQVFEKLSGHGTNQDFVNWAGSFLANADAIAHAQATGSGDDGALALANLRKQRDQIILNSGYSPEAFSRLLQVRQALTQSQAQQDANNAARLASMSDSPVFSAKRHTGGQMLASNEYVLKNTEGLVLTGSRMEKMMNTLGQLVNGQDTMAPMAREFMGRGVGESRTTHEHSGSVGVELSGHADLVGQIAEAVAGLLSQNSGGAPMHGQRIRKRYEG